MNDDEVRDRLRKLVTKAGSQKAWALQHGFSEQYVSDVLNGKRTVMTRQLPFVESEPPIKATPSPIIKTIEVKGSLFLSLSSTTNALPLTA